MRRTYAVIYENGPNNLSAYVPDLPGCVTVGHSLEEIRANMKEPIVFHIDLLLQHGESIPEPRTSIQEALDLHGEDLLNQYEELRESVPEPPAIVELMDVDASPDAIQREYGHLLPRAQVVRTSSV